MQLKVYSSVPLKEVKNGHREQLTVSATLGNNRSLRQVGRFHFFFSLIVKVTWEKLKYAKV